MESRMCWAGHIWQLRMAQEDTFLQAYSWVTWWYLSQHLLLAHLVYQSSIQIAQHHPPQSSFMASHLIQPQVGHILTKYLNSNFPHGIELLAEHSVLSPEKSSLSYVCVLKIRSYRKVLCSFGLVCACLFFLHVCCAFIDLCPKFNFSVSSFCI